MSEKLGQLVQLSSQLITGELNGAPSQPLRLLPVPWVFKGQVPMWFTLPESHDVSAIFSGPEEPVIQVTANGISEGGRRFTGRGHSHAEELLLPTTSSDLGLLQVLSSSDPNPARESSSPRQFQEPGMTQAHWTWYT